MIQLILHRQHVMHGLIALSLVVFSILLVSCQGGGNSQTQTTTVPPAPAGVTVISGNGLIALGWQASSGASSYTIYVATSAGVTKSNYNTLPGGMKLTGVKSPYTLTGLSNGTTYHTVVTAVNAAGESGESGAVQGMPVAGPGDTGNYMPLTVGSEWNTNVKQTATGAPETSFTRTTTISGTKTVNGATALVLAETDSNAPHAVYEEYLLKDSNGIILLGDNDTTDVLSPQLMPYWGVKFPIQTGSSFTQVNKTGLNFGEDLDGDGINEKADISASVAVVAMETVTVPAGTFPNCAREATTILVTVRLSKTGSSVNVIGTQTTWYAPGVGMVKVTGTTSSTNYSETETEELTSYIVN